MGYSAWGLKELDTTEWLSFFLACHDSQEWLLGPSQVTGFLSDSLPLDQVKTSSPVICIQGEEFYKV